MTGKYLNKNRGKLSLQNSITRGLYAVYSLSRLLYMNSAKHPSGCKRHGAMKHFRVVVLIVVLVGASRPLCADLQVRFWSDRDGDVLWGKSLFVMNLDGSAPVNVHKKTGLSTTPVSSPDGTKIAFNSSRGRDSEIYVMDADGSNVVKLSNKSISNHGQSWSPDGTQILWYGWPDDLKDNIGRLYLNDADGSNWRDLGHGLWPQWSFDGTMIGFTHPQFPYTAMIMNADGSDRRPVTNRIQHTSFGSWSSDATAVAFGKILMNNDVQLHLVNLDGTGLINLNDKIGRDCYDVNWSPDGKRIAFTTSVEWNHSSDIIVSNVDGSNAVNVTKPLHHGRAMYSQWSPDGGTILFQTNRDGNFEIYTMNADGSNPVNLTNHPADDVWPSWTRLDLNLLSVAHPSDRLIATWGELKLGNQSKR